MRTERFVADCRKMPSESNCSLLVAGTQDEVLDTTVEHAIRVHGHARSPELREGIRRSLEREEGSGSAQRNRELATGIYDAFNRRDFVEIERNAHPQAVLTNVATGETFQGPGGFRRYAEGWARAFPDSKVEVQRIFASDDGYVAEFIGSGTHAGPLSGPAGNIPPTGRRIRQRFAEVMTVRDGSIVEGRVYFDLLSMLGQLGLVPQPGLHAGAQPVIPPGATRTQEQAPDTRRH